METTFLKERKQPAFETGYEDYRVEELFKGEITQDRSGWGAYKVYNPEREQAEAKRKNDIHALEAVWLYDEDTEAKKLVDEHERAKRYAGDAKWLDESMYGFDYAKAADPDYKDNPVQLLERLIPNVPDETRQRAYRKELEKLQADNANRWQYFGLYGRTIRDEVRARHAQAKAEREKLLSEINEEFIRELEAKISTGESLSPEFVAKSGRFFESGQLREKFEKAQAAYELVATAARGGRSKGEWEADVLDESERVKEEFADDVHLSGTKTPKDEDFVQQAKFRLGKGYGLGTQTRELMHDVVELLKGEDGKLDEGTLKLLILALNKDATGEQVVISPEFRKMFAEGLSDFVNETGDFIERTRLKTSSSMQPVGVDGFFDHYSFTQEPNLRLQKEYSPEVQKFKGLLARVNEQRLTPSEKADWVTGVLAPFARQLGSNAIPLVAGSLVPGGFLASAAANGAAYAPSSINKAIADAFVEDKQNPYLEGTISGAWDAAAEGLFGAAIGKVPGVSRLLDKLAVKSAGAYGFGKAIGAVQANAALRLATGIAGESLGELVVEDFTSETGGYLTKKLLAAAGANLSSPEWEPMERIAGNFADGRQAAATVLYCATLGLLGIPQNYHAAARFQSDSSALRAVGLKPGTARAFSMERQKANEALADMRAKGATEELLEEENRRVSDELNAKIREAYRKEVLEEDPVKLRDRLSKEHEFYMSQMEAEASAREGVLQAALREAGVLSTEETMDGKFRLTVVDRSQVAKDAEGWQDGKRPSDYVEPVKEVEMTEEQMTAWAQMQIGEATLKRMKEIRSAAVALDMAGKVDEGDYARMLPISRAAAPVAVELAKAHGTMNLAVLQALAKAAKAEGRQGVQALPGVSNETTGAAAASFERRLDMAEAMGEIAPGQRESVGAAAMRLPATEGVASRIVYNPGHTKAVNIAEDAVESMLTARLKEEGGITQENVLTPKGRSWLEGMLGEMRRVNEAVKQFSGRELMPGLEKAEANLLTVTEYFSHLAQSDFYRRAGKYGLSPEAQRHVAFMDSALMQGRLAEMLDKGFGKWIGTKEGKAWEQAGGTLASLLREAGHELGSLYNRSRVTAEHVAAVEQARAYMREAGKVTLAEVEETLKQAAEEQEERDNPQEFSGSIPAEESVTGEEIPDDMGAAAALYTEDGELIAPPGTEVVEPKEERLTESTPYRIDSAISSREEAKAKLKEAGVFGKPLTNALFPDIRTRLSGNGFRKLSDSHVTKAHLVPLGYTVEQAQSIHMTAVANIASLFEQAKRIVREAPYHGEGRKAVPHLYCDFEIPGYQRPFTADISLIQFEDKNKGDKLYALHVEINSPGESRVLTDKSANDRSPGAEANVAGKENIVKREEEKTPLEEGGARGVGLEGGRFAPLADGSVMGVARVDSIGLCPDVPQFKTKAAASGRTKAGEDGTTHELAGGFRKDAPPITVWRRTDGALQVITGRHRLAHARKCGETFIAVRVYDEDAAHDAAWAKLYDVEMNILDRQAGAQDVAYFFRNAGMSLEEAEARGLMPRRKDGEQTATGTIGIAVALNACDEVYTRFINGALGEKQAYFIATLGADEAAQELALKLLSDKKPKSFEYVQAYVAAAREQRARSEAPAMFDLFGKDESWAQEADKLARYVEAARRQVSAQLGILKGAGTLKRKEQAAGRLGVTVKTPRDLTRLLTKLTIVEAALERMDASLGLGELAAAWDGKSSPDLETLTQRVSALGEKMPGGESSFSASFSVIGERAATWDKYKDRAFKGRDDGMLRAEIDASGAKLKWEDLRGKNTAAYLRLVAGWDKLPEKERKQVEDYAEKVDNWQKESEKLNSIPESEFLEQYKKVVQLRDALKPKRAEIRSLLNKMLVAHGGGADVLINKKDAELDKLVMSLWGGNVERKVEKMLDLGPLWYGMKLADVLDYPELYDAYPELEDVTVRYDAMDDANGRALYGNGEPAILINRNLEGEWSRIRSILLHEIQHHIQHIEGFAKGGTPSYARRLVNNRAAMGDADALALRDYSDMELYHRIAGEIEARNVQERMDWPMDEREAYPFNSTLEYPGEALVTFSVEAVPSDVVGRLRSHFEKDPRNGAPPAGWWVHGRSGRQDLETGHVLQMTRSNGVGMQYGASGSVWYLRPKADAHILDASTVEGKAKIREALIEGLENGTLPMSYERMEEEFYDGEGELKPEAVEKYVEAFNPKNIVDSAEAFDDVDWCSWLWERLEPDMVVTQDGAVVLNQEAMEGAKVYDARVDWGSFSVEAEEEMAEIKRKSIDEGWFMKAPNGEATKLTERQWLQVRTKAFKNWFGDWEKAATFRAVRDAIMSMPTVTEISGKEFQSDGVPLTDKVPAYWQGSYHGGVESPELGRVILDKEGVKSSMGHGIGALKAAAFYAVPEVIQKGKVFDRQQNWKGRGYDTAVLAAPISIAGNEYICEVIVEQRPNRQGFYLHEVEVKEKLGNVFKTSTEGGTRQAPRSILALRDAEVNTIWENCSKVVDENGEPLVVYHGTSSPEPFTVFGEKKASSQGSYLEEDQQAFFFAKEKEADFYNNSSVPLMACFLSLKNPNTVDIAQEIEDILWNYDGNRDEAVSDGYPLDRWEGKDHADFEANDSATAYFDDHAQELYEDAKEQGKDGIMLYGADGTMTVLAFEPTQIKSAIDNRGTFDGSNPDITYSLTLGSVQAAQRAVQPYGREAVMEQMVRSIERAGRMWATTFAERDPMESRDVAAEQMGRLMAMAMGIYRALPDGYRARAHLPKLLRRGQRLALELDGVRESQQDSLFPEIEKNEAEGVQQSIAELYGEIAHAAAGQMRRYLRDTEVSRIARLLERFTPRVGKNGKMQKGKLEAAMYRKLARLTEMMRATEAVREENIAALAGRIAEAEEREDTQEADRLTAEQMEWCTFGAIKAQSLDAVRKAHAQLLELIGSGRTRWERKMEESKRHIEWLCNKAVAGMGEANDTDLAKARRKAKKRTMWQKLKEFPAYMQSIGQLFYGLGGVPGLGAFADASCRDVTRGHMALAARERDLTQAMEAKLEELGLKTQAQKADFMQHMKSVEDTGVVPEPDIVTRRVKLSMEEARRWVTMSKKERERERETLRKKSEEEQREIPDIPMEEDIVLLAMELEKAASGKRERKWVTAERQVRVGEKKSLRLNRDQALNLILLCEQERYRSGSAAAHGYTDAVLAKLREFVGEKGMAFGYWMRDYLSGTGLAEVFEAREGVPFPAEENYWPGVFDQSGRMNENMNALDSSAGQNSTRYSMLKVRVNHTLNFDLSMGATNAFMGAIAMQNNYICMGELTSQWRRMLANARFARSLRQKAGESAFRAIKDGLNLLDGQGIAEAYGQKSLSRLLSMAQAAHAPAVLAGSFTTLLKQYSALMHATSFPGISAPRLIGEIITNRLGSGKMTYAKMRDEAIFRNRVGNKDVWAELLTMEEDVKWSRLAAWSRKGMNWLEKTDVAANLVSMTALYNILWKRMSEEGGRTEEDMHAACMAAVERTMDLAAQPTRRSQKSLIQAVGGGGVWNATAFYMATEVMNKMGMVIATYKRGGGGKKGLRKSMKFLVTMSCAEQAMMVIIDLLRGSCPDTDNEDGWLQWLALHAATGITGAGLLSGVPILGSFVNNITGGYVKTNSLADALGLDILRNGKKLYRMATGKKERSAAEWSLQLLNASRALTGGLGALGGGTQSCIRFVSSATSALQSVNAAANIVRPALQRATNIEKQDKNAKKTIW